MQYVIIFILYILAVSLFTIFNYKEKKKQPIPTKENNNIAIEYVRNTEDEIDLRAKLVIAQFPEKTLLSTLERYAEVARQNEDIPRNKIVITKEVPSQERQEKLDKANVALRASKLVRIK